MLVTRYQLSSESTLAKISSTSVLLGVIVAAEEKGQRKRVRKHLREKGSITVPDPFLHNGS